MLYKGFWDVILEETQNDNPFIEFAWFQKWWEIVGANKQVVVYAVQQDDAIIGFFPFSIQKKWGIHVFASVGENIAKYAGFIVKRNRLRDTVCFVFDSILKRHRHVLFSFHGLLESKLSTKVMEQFFVERQARIHISRSVSPYFAFGQTDFPAYFNTQRKIDELDIKEKKLRNLGFVNCRTPWQNELEQMFTLFDRYWSKKINTSSFTVGKKREFFEQLAFIKNEACKIEIDAFVFENQWLAFTYGICCRGRYVSYAFGHEPNFHVFGVGRLATQEMMKRTFSERYKMIDVNTEYEPYKFDGHTGLDFTRKVLVSGGTKWANLFHRCVTAKEHIKAMFKPKRNVMGHLRYLVKRGRMNEWLHYGQRFFGRIFKFKLVDVYELAGSVSTIPGRPVGPLYEEMHIQEAMQLAHENLIVLFYKGYTVYKDRFAKTSKCAFALHTDQWHLDALQIVEPLPKHTQFLAQDDKENIDVITAFFQKTNPGQALWVTAEFWQWQKRRRLQQLGLKRISRATYVKCGRFERSRIKGKSERGGVIHSIH